MLNLAGRNLAAAIMTVSALGCSAALAQQSAPDQSPAPAERAMPQKESGPAQLPSQAQAAQRQPAGGAAGPIVAGADPETILSAARARGDARLTADSHGDPLIEAIAEGRLYDVTFFECRQNRDCRSVMLRGAFPADGHTAAEMADWNRTQRFGKAYLDLDGNPTVELNLNLTGGVTRANLDDTLDRWATVLSEFAGHVGY